MKILLISIRSLLFYKLLIRKILTGILLMLIAIMIFIFPFYMFSVNLSFAPHVNLHEFIREKKLFGDSLKVSTKYCVTRSEKKKIPISPKYVLHNCMAAADSAVVTSDKSQVTSHHDVSELFFFLKTKRSE